MDKVKAYTIAVLRFIGVSLLIDIGMFVLVSISCLIGTRCSNVAYSERMFWVSMAALLVAMPGILSALGTHQGYYSDPMTAGMDAKVARTIAEDGHLSLNKRTGLILRAASVGAIGIGFSALIDILG